MLTKRERRLISAMNLGFNITHQDGHRWIDYEFQGYLGEELEKKMDKNGIILKSKICGSYDNALDRIDKLLVLMGFDKLEDMYIDFGE